VRLTLTHLGHPSITWTPTAPFWRNRESNRWGRPCAEVPRMPQTCMRERKLSGVVRGATRPEWFCGVGCYQVLVRFPRRRLLQGAQQQQDSGKAASIESLRRDRQMRWLSNCSIWDRAGGGVLIERKQSESVYHSVRSQTTCFTSLAFALLYFALALALRWLFGMVHQ
jgi:hypothetical protein